MPTSADAVTSDVPKADTRPAVWTRDGRGITLCELADSAHISYWRVYRLSRRGVFGNPVRLGNVDLYEAQIASAYLVNRIPTHGQPSEAAS
jgi:hypothetical protein